MTGAPMDRLGRRLLIGLVLGVAVLAVMMVVGDVQSLGQALVSWDASVLPAVLGLSLCGYGFRACRWELVLRQLGVSIPWTESVLVFLAGLVMSITPGKVGEVLKSFLLARSHGVPVERTAPIVVLERFTDLVALLLLAAWGVAASGLGGDVLVAGVALAAGAMVLLAWPAAGRAAIALVARFPGGRPLAGRLRDAHQVMLSLMGVRTLVVTSVLGLLAWSCEALGTWWVLRAFADTTASLPVATFVFSLATIAGAVSMLPGGLVATEGSMIALLHAGLRVVPTVQVATAVTLIVRFCTLWFGVALGALALAVHRHRHGERV